MGAVPARVVAIPKERTAEVVAVLSQAFFDYPVMRFVLSDAGNDYRRHLEGLVDFFVAARVLRDEPMLGVDLGGRLAAAAIMTPPETHRRPPPDELLEKRQKLWRSLGTPAEQRYGLLGEVWPEVGVAEPNLHLNMIGVLPSLAGSGLGGLLLTAVHSLSAGDPESTGVSLTTELAANVSYYRNRGYRLVGHRQVTDGLATWGMFRPDPVPS